MKFPLKILFGINTNGQGHINRASSIIRQFKQDGHHVDTIFSGPKPPSYVKKWNTRMMEIDALRLVYRRTDLDLLKTVITNVQKMSRIIGKSHHLIPKIKRENYDLIVTDFDLITSTLGQVLDIPVLSIDHQHSLIHKKAILPRGYFMDRFVVNAAIFFTVPFKSFYIGIDYVDEIKVGHGGILHPLVEKIDINGHRNFVGDHYTVYLYTHTPRELVEILSQFPEEKFKVYGLHKSLKKGNVEFMPTSREGFLSDFLSSKGIIAHSGFSITWEAAQAGKPIFAIPQRHFEQITNAYRVQQQKIGYTAKEFTVDTLKEFIDFCEQNNFNIGKKLPIVSMEKFIGRIYSIIDRISCN